MVERVSTLHDLLSEFIGDVDTSEPNDDSGLSREVIDSFESEGTDTRPISTLVPIDSTFSDALKLFRNPETGLSEIEIFQQAYMGYDPETETSIYDGVLDGEERVGYGNFDALTRHALQEMLDEQIANNGAFTVFADKAYLLPQHDEKIVDDQSVLISNVQPEPEPKFFEGVSTNRFSESARTPDPESSRTEPAVSSHVSTKEYFYPTDEQVDIMLRHFIETEMEDPRTRTKALNVLALMGAEGMEEGNKVAEFNDLLSRLEICASAGVAPDKIQPELVRRWNAFLDANVDRLYVSANYSNDQGVFDGATRPTADIHLSRQWQGLLNALNNPGEATEEDRLLLQNLRILLIDNPVPGSVLQEKLAENGENTVRDLYEYYRVSLWSEVLNSEKVYLDSVPLETKQQDVHERFDFDTWYKGCLRRTRSDTGG